MGARVLAAAMFADQARAFFRVAPRVRGRRRDQDFNVAARGDGEHAKTEASAQIAVAGVALTTLATRRHFCRQPNLVAGAGAVDRLQQQFKIEGQLQFADHNDRWIAAAQAHQIATANLALDDEAALFQEAFDGQIQRGFQANSDVMAVDSDRSLQGIPQEFASMKKVET